MENKTIYPLVGSYEILCLKFKEAKTVMKKLETVYSKKLKKLESMISKLPSETMKDLIRKKSIRRRDVMTFMTR